MKPWAAALVLGAAALCVLYYWAEPGERVEQPATSSKVAGPIDSSKREDAPSIVDPQSAIPNSLAGTTEDGALYVDGDGNFVVSPDAINLFDYYLSATGEESDEQIRARILAAIARDLDGANARAATELLDDYLEYRSRAGALLGGRPLGEDLERRLQYIRELRREVFGATHARALFGEEEDRWFAELERRRTAIDPTLSDEERDQRLAALDAEFPEEVIATRDAVRVHRDLRDNETRMRNEGAGEQEITQFREARFGSEAADRLAALDAQRTEWKERLADYHAERDALLRSAPAEDREALLNEVGRRHFNERELIRANATERISP